MTHIYSNCAITTLADGYGLIEAAALVVKDGLIAWVGAEVDLPEDYSNAPRTDLEGCLVTPGLIDCHTHLVFAGHRAAEFEMRLHGLSYADIAKAGGGILSSVRSVRQADFDTLVAESLPRLDSLIAEGITVVEIKSGYGLTIEDELRMLRVARHLETLRPVTIRTSWLAAHSVPPEYAGRADDYIDEVVIAGLKAAHMEGLVDAVDGYCESIAFSVAQMRCIFDAAKAIGLPIKLHAEQLSDMKGARLGADYNALSVDHLEYLEPADVPALVQSGTVATLLPGAFYMLHETQKPPIATFREQGVRMAIATDCNPGTSPMTSLLTAMNMACTLFGLTPKEALAGTTRHAAQALGLERTHGTVSVGKVADLAVWNCNHPAELSYWIGFSILKQRIVAGKPA